ncbi:phosphate ABC transporter substrate-binding protein PstS [Dactylosporangium matsuzakiense]|uniref:phosphate ABC transporter substrate-binding protein PstS n=1 Tax=Dactylosporangium matsuzakiense TaxID=53360 RepID=UPI0021C35420|nr:phosphate ABC transporter substrate-binding protein PstS [Dactylosporangium matsuzakiense]UWZ45938.1 phosphate ABC transporter substrate-binding protein PstS [Dactylosporangium matsuzakiense]
MNTRRLRWRRRTAVLITALCAAFVSLVPANPARAADFVPISGGGSTWSYNAFQAWITNVKQYQMRVDYERTGSTVGRNKFREGTLDWAASDIPYGVKDGINPDPPPARGYVYMPDTAGGTTFMYNLKIGASRVTNLRLSGENIAKIFTGVITKWNDPAIKADNPGLSLPGITIVPVVRSDGSGSSAQFTQWMVAQQPALWTAYCGKVHRDPCTQTSAYPVLGGSAMIGQAGDLGVSGYVAQADAVGSIGYVEYSYALAARFPVAKVLNKAGYYTEPTAGHVAVSLLKAKINNDRNDRATYLTQDLTDVYANTDPRTYVLSSYSYMILPTTNEYGFTNQKGYTLGEFGKYLLCQGQSQVNALGYSALPINLVQAGFGQLSQVPGAQVPATDISKCNNPTFSTDGTNTLAKNDPNPPACDRQGSTQCTTGTGGTGTGGNSNGNANNGGTGNNGTNGATTNTGGTGNTAGTGTGTGTNASGAPTGAAGSAPTCDPDTGICSGGDGAGGGGQGGGNGTAGQVDAAAVETSPALGNGMELALMVVAAALLLGLGLIPPLTAQYGANRRARRDRTEGF